MPVFMVRKLLMVLVLAVPLLASAKGAGEAAMGRFVLSCDRAGSTDAVYACALSKAVDAGVVQAQVAQACRDDQGAMPSSKPNQEVWFCAGLRQFGPGMSGKEWQSATARDCEARSRRAGAAPRSPRSPSCRSAFRGRSCTGRASRGRRP